MPNQFDRLLLFARNFFKHPLMLGWPLPSSRFLIDEVLKWVAWDRAKVIVEYGPGVGSFTVEILRRMRPEARLIAVETNEDFVRFLQETLHDPRLHLIYGSATEVDKFLPQLGYAKADYVISGIPFKTVPEDVRQGIMRATSAVLQPHGACLYYNFSSRVGPYLDRTFGKVQRDFELLNVLPARLYFCTQPNGNGASHRANGEAWRRD
jgi:phospholipid N-methyltransferase